MIHIIDDGFTLFGTLEYLHLSNLLMLLVLKFGILKYLRYVIYGYYKFWENGCGNVNYFVLVDQPMRCERPIADHGTGRTLKSGG